MGCGPQGCKALTQLENYTTANEGSGRGWEKRRRRRVLLRSPRGFGVTSWCWRVARSPLHCMVQLELSIQTEKQGLRGTSAAGSRWRQVGPGRGTGGGPGRGESSVESTEAQTLAPDGGVGSLRGSGSREDGGVRAQAGRPGDGSRFPGRECLWTPYTQRTHSAERPAALCRALRQPGTCMLMVHLGLLSSAVVAQIFLTY